MSSGREIRVFISSTFRDMEADRNELVKHVFPKLRRLCEQRGVTWGEVDLRWGITDERSAEGDVLPICLEEIERCRPYFIGLLGERYGWTPEHIDADLLARQPWLREHPDKSVTELEIIHGVLDNPEMVRRAYFYFRDPVYVEGKSSDFRDPPGSEDAKNLKSLKKRICEAGYPLKFNYSDPVELADWVLGDLTAAIDQEFPADATLEPLDRETLEHDAVAQQLAQVYIERPGYFDDLNEHARGGGPPLVVLGESGAGKSALLANWAAHYRDSNPEAPVILHFIGGTPHSADWQQMLRRVMGELKRRFDIADDVPTDAQGLRDAFPVFLASAAAGGKCVILLDALNQLDDRDAAPDLGWLPPFIPENIRLVVSTLPGRPLDALEKRDWPTMKVGLMDEDERKTLIVRYLKDKYAKELSDERVTRIAADPETANPFYLKSLLEELRLFGDHDRLDERIDHYLETESISELFARILERYEQDYERGRPHLVRDAMRHLWAARRGLSESELLDLLGDGENPLPQAHWSPLSLASNQAIVNRSGLLNFAHDYLRQAVEQKYFPDNADQQQARLAIADYFEEQQTSARKADELPWQLAQCGEAYHERLKDCIVDIDLFMELRRNEEQQSDLREYWLRVRERFDMVVEYNDALVQVEGTREFNHTLSKYLYEVGSFLTDCAKFNGAEPLYRRALAIKESELGDNRPSIADRVVDLSELRAAHDLASCLNGLALLLQSTGRCSEAEPLHRRALEIWERCLGENDPSVASSLKNLASLLQADGRFSEAEQLLSRAIAIEEISVGDNHPQFAGSLDNLASLLHDTGRLVEAELMLRRSLDVRERNFGENHLDIASSLHNLGEVLRATNRVDEAEPFYRRSLEIRRRSFGEKHPDVASSLSGLAGLLRDTNRLGEAESVYRRSLEIWKESHGENHPEVVTCLGNLASLLDETNQLAEAESLYRRALEIRERTLGINHTDIAVSLNNLASFLQKTGRLNEAEPYYRRALEIWDQSLGEAHPDFATCLNNLASLLHDENRLDEAETMFHRALRIREQHLGSNHPDVATTLNNLASLLQGSGRLNEDEPYFRRALGIWERTLGKNHPNVAKGLSNLAMLFQNTGRFAEAESLYRRALELKEQIFGRNHPNVATGLSNLASLFHETNRRDEAEPMFRRALQIREQSYGELHPDVANSLHNLAVLLRANNCLEQAEPFYCVSSANVGQMVCRVK